MKKRMYIIPETETAPLHLSACIMSGNGDGPYSGDATDDPNFKAAPKKRVF